jgi:hypothetical protein
MAADDPLNEKMKNDTQVTADLAIFVALMRRGGPAEPPLHATERHTGAIVHDQGWQNAQISG